MSDASTPSLASPEQQTLTDDEKLAFIADTMTRLFAIADQYPLITHLLSMVQEEANQVRGRKNAGAGGGASLSVGG